MKTLYMDPGYTNVGWAHSDGTSGYVVLHDDSRVAQLKALALDKIAQRIVIEDYDARSEKISGSKTYIVIGMLQMLLSHRDVIMVKNATWTADFARKIERNFDTIEERIGFVDRFDDVRNVHERDACKIRYAFEGKDKNDNI